MRMKVAVIASMGDEAASDESELSDDRSVRESMMDKGYIGADGGRRECW